MATLTSAAPVLALLEEPSDDLRAYALQQLNSSVDDFWYEVSGSIAAIESLYEDDEFGHRELAALLASKVSPLSPERALDAYQATAQCYWNSDCGFVMVRWQQAQSLGLRTATHSTRLTMDRASHHLNLLSLCRSSTTWVI